MNKLKTTYSGTGPSSRLVKSNMINSKKLIYLNNTRKYEKIKQNDHEVRLLDEQRGKEETLRRQGGDPVSTDLPAIISVNNLMLSD